MLDARAHRRTTAVRLIENGGAITNCADPQAPKGNAVTRYFEDEGHVVARYARSRSAGSTRTRRRAYVFRSRRSGPDLAHPAAQRISASRAGTGPATSRLVSAGATMPRTLRHQPRQEGRRVSIHPVQFPQHRGELHCAGAATHRWRDVQPVLEHSAGAVTRPAPFQAECHAAPCRRWAAAAVRAEQEDAGGFDFAGGEQGVLDGAGAGSARGLRGRVRRRAACVAMACFQLFVRGGEALRVRPSSSRSRLPRPRRWQVRPRRQSNGTVRAGGRSGATGRRGASRAVQQACLSSSVAICLSATLAVSRSASAWRARRRPSPANRAAATSSCNCGRSFSAFAMDASTLLRGRVERRRAGLRTR